MDAICDREFKAILGRIMTAVSIGLFVAIVAMKVWYDFQVGDIKIGRYIPEAERAAREKAMEDRAVIEARHGRTATPEG